jgi:hypothetical protein
MNRARQSHNPESGPPQEFGNNGNNPSMNTAGRGPPPYDGPGSETSQQGGPRQNPFAPGLGYDPAKPAGQKESMITNTRIELPYAAYALDTTGVSCPLFTQNISYSYIGWGLSLGEFNIKRTQHEDSKLRKPGL